MEVLKIFMLTPKCIGGEVIHGIYMLFRCLNRFLLYTRISDNNLYLLRRVSELIFFHTTGLFFNLLQM